MLYLRRKTKWKTDAEDAASKSVLRYAKDDDIAKSNYEYNSTIDLSKYDGKYINDQNTGPVSQLKFGNRQMYYNGCEIIATYNAMRTLGKPEDIRDIAYEYEKDGKMLGGEFGTNPYAAQRYFERKGYKVETVRVRI